MGPAASDCRSGRVADTDGPALCFRMRCVRVSRAVLCPGRSRARLHGSLRPGRGHWPGLLELTPGPGPRPSSSTGPSADRSRSGQVRAASFRVILRSGGYVRALRRAADSAQVRRALTADCGSPGPGPRPGAPGPAARAACCRRQFPAAHRPSVPRGQSPQGPQAVSPRVSSPWLTSHQRSQFPAAHGQSVPRGSRAVSSRWLTGRQFPRSIPAGPLAGYFRVGAPCEGPAVPRRDPRPGALVRCAARGRRTTRTAADSAGLRPGVRPGCRSRANVTPHYVRSPASSGPDPGPRHRHWGLLALAIESGSGRGEQGGASEVYSQRPAAARARSWHRHRLGFRGPAAWPTAMRHFG